MIHFCMFGGHGGELSLGKRLYITLFGGSELRRPTLARQIVEFRRNGGQIRTRFAFFITIFGGTEIKLPTLAEEYLELQDALRANLFTLEDWDRAVGPIAAGDLLRFGSFTMCGGFDGALLPTEDEELDRLALTRHLNQIPEEAGAALMHAIGQPGSQRPAAVRHALAYALAR